MPNLHDIAPFLISMLDGCPPSLRSVWHPQANADTLGSARRSVEWLEPWHPITGEPDQVAAMERELKREIADGHALHGLPVRALARRQDCDDVLFTIDDGSGRVAVVHLTWTSAPPERPPWPSSAVFTSLEAWRSEVMRPDHDEFCDA